MPKEEKKQNQNKKPGPTRGIQSKNGQSKGDLSNSIDQILRPTTWDEYVGQDVVKKNLKVIIEAAKRRNECIDHLLFYGQAGLGKTTLAHLVCHEMGSTIKVTSGPTLEKVGDIAAVLSNLEEGDVLFIDEIHRLNRLIEEVFYPALESRKLHLMVGKGPGARSITLDLPAFTLIGATTRMSLLSGPLRSRFGATFKLDYYSLNDIVQVIKRSSKLLDVVIDEAAIAVLSRASRATPRVANRLLKRVRDFAEVKGEGRVDETICKKALSFLGIDERGLEDADRRFLEAVITKFSGGPVGVNALAAALNEDRGTIEDVYEPYLMSLGFLERTPAGRIATEAAYKHLGIKTKGTLI